MINFSVRNSNEIAILTLATLEDISKFFNDKQILNCNAPAELIMHLTINYYRHTYNGINYYLHIMNIDNKNETVTICYDQVTQ